MPVSSAAGLHDRSLRLACGPARAVLKPPRPARPDPGTPAAPPPCDPMTQSSPVVPSPKHFTDRLSMVRIAEIDLKCESLRTHSQTLFKPHPLSSFRSCGLRDERSGAKPIVRDHLVYLWVKLWRSSPGFTCGFYSSAWWHHFRRSRCTGRVIERDRVRESGRVTVRRTRGCQAGSGTAGVAPTGISLYLILRLVARRKSSSHPIPM